ncbi:response regulator transcription factor [Streptomyces sp. NBC_01294]|uniref:response regulator transcription factor n=1 Tax=Streptomyces sp. NBC_01294 TaxID=2903815 RepID=UPI002DDB827A|nr:helix-turn-helix transcriptional regulator [Streptomyces sp. NBC_01294]WRZ61552.1 helix-turn-helix transcriptional regulator [Streptomyces sp. NBC_01294]
MSLTLTMPQTQTQTQAPAVALAPREQEALGYIAAGHTYLQTARQMGLSKHTVDAYLRRIRAKLNVHTTAELTRLAMSLGL